MTTSIFDPVFNGMARSELYRGWVMPELFPAQPQPLLVNWDWEDKVSYVGAEYAKAAYENAIR